MFEDDFAPPMPPRPNAFSQLAPEAHNQLPSPTSSCAILSPASNSTLRHTHSRPRFSTNPSATSNGLGSSPLKSDKLGPGEWMRSRSRSVSAEPPAASGVPPPIPKRPALSGRVKDNLAERSPPDPIQNMPLRNGGLDEPERAQLDIDGDIAMASPSIESNQPTASSTNYESSCHPSPMINIDGDTESSRSATTSGYGSVLQPITSDAIPPVTGDSTLFSPASPAISATSFPLPPQKHQPPSTVSRPPRPLPPRPHAPPPTMVPAWEPDIKSHIPPSLTLDSRLAAYSTQAAPPPRLRTAVKQKEERKRGGREGYGRLRGRAEKEELILDRRVARGGVSDVVAGSSASHAQSAREDLVRGIAGEWWLDPVIVTRNLMAEGKDAWGGRATYARSTSTRTDQNQKRDALMADGGLHRLGPNPAVKCARLGGLDGKINARFCIIDESLYGVASSSGIALDGARPDFVDGLEQTRTKAGIEVESRKGDVRIEMAQMDRGRQIALSVKSRSGNILVLLPDTYRGTIHCSTASNRTTTVLPALRKRFRIVKDRRGETVGYLDIPSSVNVNVDRIAMPPPDLPARRSSARLRGMAADSSMTGIASSSRGAEPYPRDGSWRRAKAKEQGRVTGGSDSILDPGTRATVCSSPPPISVADVDMDDDRTGQATVADDDAIKYIDEDVDGPDSLVTLSSYTGEVAIGLYGHEGEEEFLKYVPGFGNGKRAANSTTTSDTVGPGLRARSASIGLGLDGMAKGRASEGVAGAVAKGKGKGKAVMMKGRKLFGA